MSQAELHEGNIEPDPNADFKLYDRVVCVSRHSAAPAGARGTLTAVHVPSAAANTVRLSDKLNARPSYQVMFDEPFHGAITENLFDEPRFYRSLFTPVHTNYLFTLFAETGHFSLSFAYHLFTLLDQK